MDFAMLLYLFYSFKGRHYSILSIFCGMRWLISQIIIITHSRIQNNPKHSSRTTPEEQKAK